MTESPTHSSGALCEIRWNEVCPWILLVRSLRAALLVRVLLLAFVGVVLTEWGWAAIDRICSDHPAQLEQFIESNTAAAVDHGAQRPTIAEQATTGPLPRAWRWLTSPWIKAVSLETSWQRGFSLLLSGLWAIGVWAMLGGAICRIAAIHLTRGETIGPIVACRSALSTWAGTAGAPLIALMGAAALAVPAVVAGLLIRLDFLALATGLAWGFVLAWGLMLAVVILGLAIGWPLMWATLAVDRSDAFDGVSRCYAYVYQRPLQLAFYVVIAALLGLLGEVVVYYFAQAAIAISEWTVSWGAGSARTTEMTIQSPAELGGMAGAAAQAIHFWKWVLLAIAASYPLAYLWTTSVAIYLLLRQQVDSTELDEISLDDEPQKGLPNLESTESEVPYRSTANTA